MPQKGVKFGGGFFWLSRYLYDDFLPGIFFFSPSLCFFASFCGYFHGNQKCIGFLFYFFSFSLLERMVPGKLILLQAFSGY